MAKPFRRHLEAMPVERRERIEDDAQELGDEYELLQALRRDRKISQAQVAELMGIKQASVSKVENQVDMRLSTLVRYAEALGGELEVRIRFPDRDVLLDPTAVIARARERVARSSTRVSATAIVDLIREDRDA